MAPDPDSGTDPRRWIPHREPILCIDRVTAIRPDGATAERRVPASPDGPMWEGWLIEGLAQTAAAMRGGQPDAGGSAQRGMLVGLRDVAFGRRPLPGELVEFEVVLLKQLGTLTLFAATARAGGEVVARGTMKFHIEVDA
ncbi:MAG: hypothetical protein H6837_08030 [Planctomycetes bacterium]|nr:hypothetical protein [Planctomycetota bacterium]